MAQTPLPPAPGVVELKASYLQGQQVLQNTFHVHKSGSWSPEQLGDLIDIYTTWETDTASDERSNTCALAEVRATDLTSSTANYRSSDINPAIFGSRASQALPENVTWAIQAGTGKRGRGQQGRVFWIGLCEDQTDGSTMVVARATAIVAAMNALLAAINGGSGGAMAILHRQLAGAPLNPATSSDIGTWGASDLTTDSQKNRLPNHRRHKRPTP